MKLSMGAWSFSFGPFAAEPKPLDEIAKRLAKAGFDGIELSGHPPHVTIDRYSTAATRAELCRFLSDLGLGISGFSADLTGANPLAVQDRGAYLDLFKRNVELCAAIGCPSLRVDTFGAPGSIADDQYHAVFHRLADLWRDCADAARQAQVPIVWEFEPGFVFNKQSEINELHEQVGHPWFRILFDTSHAYMCSVVGARQHGKREVLEGGTAQFLEMLHGAMGAVHVIDSDGSLVGDETSTHVPIGAGRIPWNFLAPRLLSVPHVEWWCADLCFCAEAWEQVEDNLKRARELVAMASAVSPA